MAFGLIAAACSEDTGDEGEASTPASAPAETDPADTTPAETTPGETTPTETDPPDTEPSGDSGLDAAIAHALAYTGGAGGAAEGDPIVIGYINQEGGTPAFPEATIGTEAAVKYVNEVLGGAGGRPLELKTCIVNAPEDGTACAQEMLADDAVSVVLTGVVVLDAIAQPIYDILKDQKPIIIGNPVVTPDFLATDGYAFTPGSPGVVQGLAVFAATGLGDTLPDKVAVVHSDNSSGTIAFTALTKPVLEALGVPSDGIKGVAVPDTAGPTEFAPAIQAAGAADADVIIPLVTVQGCIGVAQALKDLGIDTPVVTTGLCFGTPMTEYLAQQGESGIVPDGWYFGGYGYSYFIPGQADLDSYVAMIQQYAVDEGIENIEYTGFAGPQFGTILTITKWINEMGADAVSPDSIRSAAKAFEGPMWGVVGPMSCGSNPVFPSLCGIQMGIQQYSGEEWTSIRDGYNGDPVDPSVEIG
jgi:branched-chain amino acid transport system substrate-binding protein